MTLPKKEFVCRDTRYRGILRFGKLISLSLLARRDRQQTRKIVLVYYNWPCVPLKFDGVDEVHVYLPLTYLPSRETNERQTTNSRLGNGNLRDYNNYVCLLISGSLPSFLELQKRDTRIILYMCMSTEHLYKRANLCSS